MVALGGLMLIFVACGGGNKTALPDDKTLFDQGQKAEAAEQYTAACENYMALVDNYPQSPYRYKALFMAAYVQFEYLKNKKETIDLCSRLIEEYPTCDLADDAAEIRRCAITGRDLMSAIQDSLSQK